MKLLFFLAVWKRPDITEICFMGLNRLKKTGMFHMEFLAVISEESMIPLCKKYGVDYCFYKNQPLGEKKNYGLSKAFEKSWDFLIELGSDDLLKNELLELYKPHFERSALLGVSHFYFLNSFTGDCREYNTNTSYGLGRAIRRDALERVASGVEFEAYDDLIAPGKSVSKGEIGFFSEAGAKQMEVAGKGKIVSELTYKLWHDQQTRGLDNHSTFNLVLNGVMDKRIKSEKPVAIDIKGPDSMWPYNPTLGKEGNIIDLMDGLSEEEKTAIMCMIKRNQLVECA